MSGRSQRGAAAGAVGVTMLVLFLTAMLTVVVALTFSVQVSGHSMEPTLRSGDRLEVDVFARHDIHRFDVVEAIEPGDMAVAGTQRQGQPLHFLRHLGNKTIQPPQHFALRGAAQGFVIGVR